MAGRRDPNSLITKDLCVTFLEISAKIHPRNWRCASTEIALGPVAQLRRHQGRELLAISDH